MRLGRIIVVFTALLVTSFPAVASGPRVRRGPTSPRLFKERAPIKLKTHAHIEPERAIQIQNALLKAGYLTGQPSGAWDAQTEAAVQKLQADNGWQTRLVPDARAIIKLGLGPNSTQPNGDLAVTPGASAETAPAIEATNPPVPVNQ